MAGAAAARAAEDGEEESHVVVANCGGGWRGHGEAARDGTGREEHTLEPVGARDGDDGRADKAELCGEIHKSTDRASRNPQGRTMCMKKSTNAWTAHEEVHEGARCT
uniref:Uncharacterized protein n=1 Tax=Oryza glumipatula TaxID=40148 RepID=A0A0E0B1Z1_9ORYZ